MTTLIRAKFLWLSRSRARYWLKPHYVRPFLWVNRQTADQSEDYNKCGVFIGYANAVCVCVYFCVFLFVRVSLSGQWCWLWCNRATDQPLLLITWCELQSINTTLSQMLQCAVVAVLYIWPFQRMWPKCDQRDLNVWMMKCLPHHCWSPCAICSRSAQSQEIERQQQ